MSALEEFSQQLFAVFADCLPPPAESNKRSVRYEADAVARLLGRFHDKARELRRTHRPGVLARARIVLALQQRLLAAGYPSDMVRQVLFSLILSAFVGKV